MTMMTKGWSWKRRGRLDGAATERGKQGFMTKFLVRTCAEMTMLWD